MKKVISFMMSMVLLLSVYVVPVKAEETLPEKQEIYDVIEKVNNYFISLNGNYGDSHWRRGAYQTGNMAVYNVKKDPYFLNYAIGWANKNNWATRGYYVGGTPDTHADAQTCGQTFIDLYELDPDPNKLKVIKQSVDIQVNRSKIDDWWWIDAFYMSMPVFTRLGNIYNDTAYTEKMYALFNDAKVRRGLYDEEVGLWYRDENYKYPQYKTGNGKKIFWARGNGWVFAGLARVMEYLPESDPHYAEYKEIYLEMAEALRIRQQSDGFWRSSLDDPVEHPSLETSGTSFFVYGMAWGMDKGFLDKDVYLPVAAKAWNAMVENAVHPSGKVGHIQKPAGEPGDGHPFSYDSYYDYGVGAFLLAGSELIKLADGEFTQEPANIALNKTVTASSAQEGNEQHRLTDGTTATRWSAQTFPQWAQIDLGTTYRVDKAILSPYLDRAYQYIIEGSVDGENYTTIVDRSDNTTGGLEIEDAIEGFVGRYVKVTVTAAYNDDTEWVSLLELKLQGEEEDVPNPPVVLFEDTFDGNIDNYTTVGPNWQVANGVVTLPEPVEALPLGNLLVHPTELDSTYTLTARGKISNDSEWDDVVMIFGYKDENNYYYASFNEKNDGLTNGIFKITNGEQEELTDFSANIVGDQYYEFKLVADGARMNVYVDGELRGDSAVADLTGRVGFGSRNNSPTFDYLKAVE